VYHRSAFLVHSRRVELLAIVTAWAIGCSSTDDSAQATRLRTLIDHSQWQTSREADDGFSDHRPSAVECGVAGWFVEYEALEVDTARCNYVSLTHPALIAVPVGAEAHTTLVHFDLVAEQPAQAHVALSFNGEVQWERWVDIPHPAEVIELSWEATVALAAGDPVQLHLHNHGQNTWALDRVMVEVPVE
jgi:hypothetical protein